MASNDVSTPAWHASPIRPDHDKIGKVVAQGAGRENVDRHDPWETTNDLQWTHHGSRDYHEGQSSDGR